MGFPDFKEIIEDHVIAADNVVTRVLWHGTKGGPYNGVGPPGRPMVLRDITIWRCVDGTSVENWTLLDQFALLQQIGVDSGCDQWRRSCSSTW